MSQLIIVLGGFFLLPIYIVTMLSILLSMVVVTFFGVTAEYVFCALRDLNYWLSAMLHRIYAFMQDYCDEIQR